MSGAPPLKAKPLRTAGQSLEAEINFQIGDQALGYLMATFAIIAVTIVEWIGYLLASPRTPLGYTAAALLVTAFSAWRMWVIRKRVQRLRLGRDGERAVGEFLDGLRGDGCRVIHDVPAESFNLDHVIISPRGVYVVETKTRTKPNANARILVENDTVVIGSGPGDRAIVAQARAQARWLGQLLRESTGKTLPVRGVVVFPGWFVEQVGERTDVWVLEPKAFPGFLAREPVAMSDSDVQLATFHLKRYVRTCAEPEPGFAGD